MTGEQAKLMYRIAKHFDARVSAEELFESNQFAVTIFLSDVLVIYTVPSATIGLELHFDGEVTGVTDIAYQSLLRFNDLLDSLGTPVSYYGHDEAIKPILKQLGYKESDSSPVASMWRMFNIENFKNYNGL